MIGLDLTDDQLALQDAIEVFLKEKCPVARALAPHGTDGADLELWRGLMELGVGGICVPAEFDGLGLGLLDLAIVAEAVGRYATPGPFLEHAMATWMIANGGSSAQRERWLGSLATGAALATVAFAENNGGWLASQWELSGDGTLNGVKSHVLHAEQADLIVVGLAGGAVGIVESKAAGISIKPVPSTDGGKRLTEVTFHDTRFERLPGIIGPQACNLGLILLAADAYGGASRCLDMTVDYVKEREQFGRPVGQFQAVQHQIADVAIAIEPAIGLYWSAALAFDQDAPNVSHAAALAKSYLTETYAEIARRMIELHGGLGYTWEYGAHVWLKRALFNRAYLGSPRTHRARAASLAGW